MEKVLSKKKTKKVNFTGWFIHEASRALLLARFPPVHRNVFAEHVTIKYKPSENDVNNTSIGETRVVKVIGVASDENGHAVVIDPGFQVSNPVPHITISCADGVRPVYSNKMLESGYELLHEPIELTGTLGTFP